MTKEERLKRVAAVQAVAKSLTSIEASMHGIDEEVDTSAISELEVKELRFVRLTLESIIDDAQKAVAALRELEGGVR